LKQTIETPSHASSHASIVGPENKTSPNNPLPLEAGHRDTVVSVVPRKHLSYQRKRYSSRNSLSRDDDTSCTGPSRHRHKHHPAQASVGSRYQTSSHKSPARIASTKLPPCALHEQTLPLRQLSWPNHASLSRTVTTLPVTPARRDSQRVSSDTGRILQGAPARRDGGSPTGATTCEQQTVLQTSVGPSTDTPSLRWYVSYPLAQALQSATASQLRPKLPGMEGRPRP